MSTNNQPSTAPLVGEGEGNTPESSSRTLSPTELGMVRRALSLPSTDWRSKVSFDEQRRLLATLDADRAQLGGMTELLTIMWSNVRDHDCDDCRDEYESVQRRLTELNAYFTSITQETP